ncbi:matrix metalloproteinase-25 [Cebus imitator]|uniref:matrix metalloproteinase-25 n=1 Tax=Cebus imitator TaxID=2715852 RepID=UPI00080A6A58|nr:matrix metalloproteinase-25 [Cebus imitator]
MRLQVLRLRLRLGLLALLLPLLLPPARAPKPSAQDVSLGVEWLTRYGYLPPPDPAQAQLQSPEKLSDAIKVMQRFAGLPETGLMGRWPPPLPSPALHPELHVSKEMEEDLSGGGKGWGDEALKRWLVLNSWAQAILPPGPPKVLGNQAGATTPSCSLSSFSAQSVPFSGEGPICLCKIAPSSVRSLGLFSLWSSVQHRHADWVTGDRNDGRLGRAWAGESGAISEGCPAVPVGQQLHSGPSCARPSQCRSGLSSCPLSPTDGEGTDLFAVAVHEFGHALGLGHSSAPNSIMRPFYQGPVGDPDKYRLSQDDRDGLQQLYGKAPQTPHDKPTRKPLVPPQPPAVPPDSPSSPIPDRCEGNFDAIANIRGETFFFKGPWFWRLQPSGQLVSPRPARLHRFWEGLPAQVRVVQAAYARHRDGRILLFSGPQFWVFQDRQLEGEARPLTELGLPWGEEVDAVFSWPQNGKTYLVRGRQYWRYDEAAARPDPGYPRDLSLWEGAPPSPDDVTVSNTGDTYFVKGAHYWRFPKGSIKSEPNAPQPMGPEWLGCPAPSAGPRAPRPPKATPESRGCDCQCELNQASGRRPAPLPLLLLPLLVGGVASR